MNARLAAPLVLLLIAAATAAQTTYYVNGSCGDDAWSGLSPICAAPDGPKQHIGKAVGATVAGDTVVVAPGTYSFETNHFSIVYDAITLRSSDGPFETFLVDEGEGHGTIVNIAYLDDEPAVIDGFTIQGVHTVYPAVFTLYYADAIFLNCRFIDNHGFYSGAAWVEVGSGGGVTAINCAFQDGNGGGIEVYAPTVEVVSCTFPTSGGDSVVGGIVTVANSIFRGQGKHVSGNDVEVMYSNVQGGYPGKGNIDADPLFADPAAGDLRLQPGSPCIDAGSNPAVPPGILTDLAGLPRFTDDPATPDTGLGSAPLVDIGAHEFQPACYADFTADGALDLFDFLAFVNAFNAADPAADCDHNGVLDLFDFLCFVNAFNQGC